MLSFFLSPSLSFLPLSSSRNFELLKNCLYFIFLDLEAIQKKWRPVEKKKGLSREISLPSDEKKITRRNEEQYTLFECNDLGRQFWSVLKKIKLSSRISGGFNDVDFLIQIAESFKAQQTVYYYYYWLSI